MTAAIAVLLIAIIATIAAIVRRGTRHREIEIAEFASAAEASAAIRRLAQREIIGRTSLLAKTDTAGDSNTSAPAYVVLVTAEDVADAQAVLSGQVRDEPPEVTGAPPASGQAA